jgi:hypothetical protein
MPGQKVMAQWSRRRNAGAPMVVCDMQDLIWLMNMSKTPYGGEIRKNGDEHGHDHDKKPTHLAKVEIVDVDMIDDHETVVYTALKKAMWGLDQANSYVGTFVGSLKNAGSEPVNCREFMHSWWQSRLWMGEAFKRFAEAHAAIEVLQAHVCFLHECAEDPCVEPEEFKEFRSTKGAVAKRRQAQQTQAEAK